MRYVIKHPETGKWDIYEADKYDKVRKLFNIRDDGDRARFDVVLDCIRVRRFETRSSAKMYVTCILGGTL